MSWFWEGWPATQSLQKRQPAWPTEPIPIRRGVYGKAHRAPTDYRWLAATKDWQPSPTDILEWAPFGNEDQPGNFPFWRPTPDHWIAGNVYPSMSRDVDGRPAINEKQILAISPIPDFPAVWGALIFLQIVDGWNSREIWYGKNDLFQQMPRDWILPLESDEALFVKPISQAAASSRLKEGRDEILTELCESADLVQFYAQIASGVRPAVLRCKKRPQRAAQVLAALLLPIDEEIAGSLSLTSGWPGDPAWAQTLNCWNVVLLDEMSAQKVQVEPPTEEQFKKGTQWAERFESGPITTAPPPVLVPLQAPLNVSATETKEPPSISKPSAQQELTILVQPPAAEEILDEAPPPSSVRHPLELEPEQLTSPTLIEQGGRSQALTEFLEFARDDLRRSVPLDLIRKNWLEPSVSTSFCQEALQPLKRIRFLHLKGWNQVSDDLSNWKRRQFEAKYNFCLAWLLAFCPHDEVAEFWLGFHRQPCLPDHAPLLLASYRDSSAWMKGMTITPESFCKLASQTQSLLVEERAKKFKDWENGVLGRQNKEFLSRYRALQS